MRSAIQTDRSLRIRKKLTLQVNRSWPHHFLFNLKTVPRTHLCFSTYVRLSVRTCLSAITSFKTTGQMWWIVSTVDVRWIMNPGSGRATARVRFATEVRFFFSLQRPNRLWGPTQPPMQWVRWWGDVSPGVKRPKREADHSHPSNAEVKNGGSYTSIPPLRLHGVVIN
jgi:hypothetical protein